MEQNANDAAAKAVAFANGLQKSISVSGSAGRNGRRRGYARPRHRLHRLASQRLRQLPERKTARRSFAACIADLRAILEWTTYQSAALATGACPSCSPQDAGIRRTIRTDRQPGRAAFGSRRLGRVSDRERAHEKRLHAGYCHAPSPALPSAAARLGRESRTENRKETGETRLDPAIEKRRERKISGVRNGRGYVRPLHRTSATDGDPFIFAFSVTKLVLAADALPSLGALGPGASLDDAICVGAWTGRAPATRLHSAIRNCRRDCVRSVCGRCTAN